MFDWLKIIDSQTFAAFFSALAALASAYAAWKGPISAARIAEEIRRENDKSVDRRRIKLNVFGALMEGRSAWYLPETVNALNLIDIAFIDNKIVRDAWAEFYISLDESKKIPDHEKQTRFRNMLKLMAEDLRLADTLRLDDFERVYMPAAILEERNLHFLQRRASLQQLTGQSVSPSANSAAPQPIPSNFPPPPQVGT
jgi:hypothetical protein